MHDRDCMREREGNFVFLLQYQLKSCKFPIAKTLGNQKKVVNANGNENKNRKTHAERHTYMHFNEAWHCL